MAQLYLHPIYIIINITLNILKFPTLFCSVLTKILVIKVGNHKMLVRIANGGDLIRLLLKSGMGLIACLGLFEGN